MRAPALLAFSLALLTACGDDSNDPGPPAPVPSSVFEIQSRSTPAGTRVVVEARVMAISSSGDRLWVSDALAAAGITGVEVFRGTGAGAMTAAVGDEIEIIGVVREFGQGAGLTVTQIAGSPEITVITPAAGAPVPLTGLDLASITLDPVPGAAQNGEAYEGVLIQLADLEIASVTPYTLTDGTTTFAVGEQIIGMSDPAGTCYATVTGIWNYDVVTDEWIIVPTVGGLVAGGTCS